MKPVYLMCVLSLPKVMSYETQIMKNKTLFEFYKSWRQGGSRIKGKRVK